MGCKVTNYGISIQVCTKDGSPDGDPIFGRYAQLYGMDRSCVTQNSGLSVEENAEPGSDDWLTLVAVADTKDKLDALLRECDTEPNDPHTSLASRRVCVLVDVRETRHKFENVLTIASGPIIKWDQPPIINVVHVKVLPEGTKMNEDHPLYKEFHEGRHGFITPAAVIDPE